MRMLDSGRKRLVAAAVVIVVLAIAAVSFYFYRTARTARIIAALRPAGIAALEAGEYRQAVDKLGTYLQRHPDDMQTLYLYSKARLQATESNGSHFVQTINVLKRIVETQPQHVEARRDLLDLYQKVNYLTETIELANDILALEAADEKLKADALFAKASALAQLRRFDEARRVLDQAKPELRHHLLALQVLRDGNRPVSEILAYAAKLGDPAKTPEDTQLLLIHGIARRLVNESAEATTLLRQAAQKPAGSDEVILELVRQLDAVGAINEATAALALAASEDRLPLRRALAARLWQAGRMDDLTALLAPVAARPADGDSQLVVYYLLLSQARGETAQVEAATAVLASRKDDVAAAWSPLIKALTLPAAEAAKVETAESLKLYDASLKLLPADPIIRLMRGQAHAAAKRYDDAAEDWLTCTRVAPSWYLPYARLSSLYLATKRFDEAFAYGQQGVVLGANRLDAAIAFTLAAAAIGEPRITDAQVLFAAEQIQKASPYEERTLVLYVSLLAKTGRLSDAKAILSAAAAEGTKLGESMLLALAAVSHEYQLEATGPLLDRSAQQHGVSPRWAGMQAALKLMADDAPGALSAFDAARNHPKATGDKRDWELNWAGLLDRVGDERAKAAVIAIADAYPQDAQVQSAVLAARSTQDDRDLQARCIARLRKLDEAGADWRFAQARWLLGREQKLKPETAAEAAVLLHEVLRARSEHVEARRLLAFCLRATDNIRGAVDQLREAVRLRPDRADLAIELASLLYISSDHSGSLQVLDQAVANMNLNQAQRHQAAALLSEQNKLDLAIATLEPAVADEQPDLLLARLYAENGDIAKARELFEKALAGPRASEPVTLLLAADFYASLGDRKRADDLLGSVSAPDAAPGVIDLMYADHYARFGLEDKAAERFAAATMAASDNAMFWRARLRFLFASGEISQAVSVIGAAAQGAPSDPIISRLNRETAWIARTQKTPVVWTLLASAAVQEEHLDPSLQAARLILESAESGKKPDEWLPLLRRNASLNSRSIAIQNVTATLLMLSGKPQDAADLAAGAMRTFPKAPEPAAIATAAYGMTGNWSEMLRTANEWKKRPGTPIAANLAVAGALMKLGRHHEAVLELEPRLPEALAHPENNEASQVIEYYANSLFVLKRYDDAAALLEPLLNSPVVRNLWWQIAMRIPDEKITLAWLDKLVAVTPADALDERLVLAEGWRALGQRLKNDEYETRGRNEIIQLAADPNATAGIHFARGSLAEIDGDLATAETHYRRSVELASAADSQRAALARNNLAMVIIRSRGNAEEALRFAQEAAAALSGVSAVQDTLAQAHVYAGQPKRALEIIVPVIDRLKGTRGIKPEHLVEFELSHAWILAEAGDVEAARSLYDQHQAEFAKLTPGNPGAQERLTRLQELLNQVNRTSSAAPIPSQ